jgi:Pectate lyase superfamily protein
VVAIPFTIPPPNKIAGVSTGLTADLDSLYNAAGVLTLWNVQNAAYSGGAAGDGTTDDTAAVQAAITACQSAGGGTVWFPPGTYIVTGLTITGSDVTLRGSGIGATIISLKNSSNTSVIAVSGTGTVNVHVEDLSIEGNKANQSGTSHGISISTPYSVTDTQHRIASVDINSVLTDGISITGDTRVVRLFHVRVKQAGGSGYNMAGSDHQVIGCIADACVNHGFVVYAGDPMFVGCKAFYCDSAVNGSAGFRVEGTGCYFTACEAQNNNENGWTIIGTAAQILLEGCTATSNGTNFAGAGSGVQVANATNVSIVGGLFTEIPGGKQVYGISLTGTTTNTRALGFTSYGNVTGPYNDASSGTNYLEVVSKAAATTAVTDTANTIASLGSLSVSAQDVAKGTRYVIRAFGTLSTAVSPGTFTCDLRWGGTGGTLLISAVTTTDSAALAASLSAVPVLIEAEVTFVTATTCVAWLRVTWRNATTAATAPTVILKTITSPVTVTTSSAQLLSLDWTWSLTGCSVTIASSAFERVS